MVVAAGIGGYRSMCLSQSPTGHRMFREYRFGIGVSTHPDPPACECCNHIR
jgi:hypothetical protein